MANFIRFRDTVEFKPTEVVESSKKDNLLDQSQGSSRPLIVKIAATHAGIITRNNGFYLPDRMKKGAASFTANYGKPVQIHHNQDADPVGRIIKAEYIDISAQAPGRVDSMMRDRFLDFAAGKLPFIASVNYISDVLNHKDSVLDDPDYEGLGYIQLTAVISDPDAAQKVMDGRYLTGSVGVSTNRAVCSVCKQDWTGDDGRCEHKPGRNYDGAKAFLITGDLAYDEYSFVNVPADRHSRVLEVNVNGITDSFEMDESVGRKVVVCLDSRRLPEDVDLKDYLSTIDSTSREETMADTENVDIDELIKLEEAADKEAIEKIFALSTVEEKIAALKVTRPFMDGLEELTAATYENVDAFYTALNDAEWAGYSELEDEQISAYLVEHPEDAKLKTAARKRLPGSSFCGPNRSFPVPDCSHVTAARRLIGRASVSSATKSRILGCVSRKATAMGCGKSTDAVVEETKTEPVVTTQDSKTPCGCEDAAAKLDAVTAELTSTKEKLATFEATVTKAAEELATLKTAHDSLAKELEDTRAELKLTHTDLTQMADQLVTSQEANDLLQATRLLDYKLLAGEKVEDNKVFLDTTVALGGEAIEKLVGEATAKVDMTKIADSINTGLTRKPTGTVEDPTANLETPVKIEKDKKMSRMIADEYQRIRLGGKSAYGSGQAAAEHYRAEMRTKGLI